MKWTNKGHEFDRDYELIKGLKKVYLFGAGHDGCMVAKLLLNRYEGLNIVGFIDNCKEQQGRTKEGLTVFLPEDIKAEDGVGIVVSFTSEYTKAIDEQLSKMGFEIRKNAWHFEQFISVYAAYEYDEVFFSSICILPTDACNLRCKGCLNFTNHIRHFTYRPIEKLKKEIDLYFKCVDYTGLFFISGGEPMLYKELPALISYIDENYRNQMYEFGIVTNGTITPSDEVLRTLTKASIKITVDDYRDALPDISGSITKNIRIYESLGKEEDLLVRSYDEWISLYPHESKEYSEEELIRKYDLCHCPWQEYRDGSLYSCNYAAFAANAGINELDEENEIYSLYNYSRENKKELAEFRLGFTEKGYVEFCKECAGYMDINPYKVKVAEQEKYDA